MKPCQMDLQFWSARNAPAWARTMLKHPPNPGLLLHEAINYRASNLMGRFVAEQRLEAGNALAVLRMVRKRGANLRQHMTEVVHTYKQLQPKRVNTYNRWLRRMEQTT